MDKNIFFIEPGTSKRFTSVFLKERSNDSSIHEEGGNKVKCSICYSMIPSDQVEHHFLHAHKIKPAASQGTFDIQNANPSEVLIKPHQFVSMQRDVPSINSLSLPMLMSDPNAPKSFCSVTPMVSRNYKHHKGNKYKMLTYSSSQRAKNTNSQSESCIYMKRKVKNFTRKGELFRPIVEKLSSDEHTDSYVPPETNITRTLNKFNQEHPEPFSLIAKSMNTASNSQSERELNYLSELTISKPNPIKKFGNVYKRASSLSERRKSSSSLRNKRRKTEGETSYQSGYESDQSDSSVSIKSLPYKYIYSKELACPVSNKALIKEKSPLFQQSDEDDCIETYDMSDCAVSTYENCTGFSCKKYFLKVKAEQLKQAEVAVKKQEEEAKNKTWLALQTQEAALNEKEELLRQREAAALLKLDQAKRLMEESKRLSNYECAKRVDQGKFKITHDHTIFTPLSNSKNSSLNAINITDESERNISLTNEPADIDPLLLSFNVEIPTETFSRVHSGKTLRTYSRKPQRRLHNRISLNPSSYNTCYESSTHSIDCPPNNDWNNTQETIVTEDSSITITPIDSTLQSYPSLPCMNILNMQKEKSAKAKTEEYPATINLSMKYPARIKLNMSSYSIKSDISIEPIINDEPSGKSTHCITNPFGCCLHPEMVLKSHQYNKSCGDVFSSFKQCNIFQANSESLSGANVQKTNKVLEGALTSTPLGFLENSPSNQKLSINEYFNSDAGLLNSDQSFSNKNRMNNIFQGDLSSHHVQGLNCPGQEVSCYSLANDKLGSDLQGTIISQPNVMKFEEAPYINNSLNQLPYKQNRFLHPVVSRNLEPSINKNKIYVESHKATSSVSDEEIHFEGNIFPFQSKAPDKSYPDSVETNLAPIFASHIDSTEKNSHIVIKTYTNLSKRGVNATTQQDTCFIQDNPNIEVFAGKVESNKIFPNSVNGSVLMNCDSYYMNYSQNNHLAANFFKSSSSIGHSSNLPLIYTSPQNDLICNFTTGTTSCLLEQHSDTSNFEVGVPNLVIDTTDIYQSDPTKASSKVEFNSNLIENVNSDLFTITTEESKVLEFSSKTDIPASCIEKAPTQETTLTNVAYVSCGMSENSSSSEFLTNTLITDSNSKSDEIFEDQPASPNSPFFLQDPEMMEIQAIKSEILMNESFSFESKVSSIESSITETSSAPKSLLLDNICVSQTSPNASEILDIDPKSSSISTKKFSPKQRGRKRGRPKVKKEPCQVEEHQSNNLLNESFSLEDREDQAETCINESSCVSSNNLNETHRLNAEISSIVTKKLPRKKRGRKRGRHSHVKKKLSCIKVEEIEDDNYSEPITCGVCENISETNSEFRKHIYFEHNGLARPKGESQDFDTKTRNQIFVNTLKITGKLVCKMCSKVFISHLGFIYHLNKSCIEVRLLLQECSICHAKISPLKIEEHKKYHEYILPHSEDTLLRPKRKSALIGLQKISMIDEIEEIDKRIKKVLKPSVPRKLLNIWQKQIRKGQAGLCSKMKCTFKSLDLTELIEHFKMCIMKNTSYLCKVCFCVSSCLEDINAHLRTSHDDNYDDKEPLDLCVPENRSRHQIYHKRMKIVDFMKEFINKNYSDLLFDEFRLLKSQWSPLCNSDMKDYYPSLPISPYYIHKNNLGDTTKIQWERISLFSGKYQNGGGILFAGGPITASAWCPMPISHFGVDQYIAISAVLQTDQELNVDRTYSHKGLLQIWNCGVPSSIAPALQFSLGVAHEFGECHSLEWCPSGIYEEYDSSKLSRLGLLLGGFSDGSVRLFLIPHPKILSSGDIISKKEPELTLLSSKFKLEAQCSKVNWFQGKLHSFIAASFFNGLVCIWNLRNPSPLLKDKDSKGRSALLPFISFQAHHGACTSVAFCPITEGKHLMTAGYDRMIKFWDLSNIDHPLAVIRKGIATDCYWLPYWPGVISTNDDVFSLSKTLTTFRENGYFGASFRRLCGSNACTNSIAVSHWFNSILHADEAGEILVGFHYSLNCNIENDKNAFKRRIHIGNIKLVDVKTNKVLSLKEEYRTGSSQNAYNDSKASNPNAPPIACLGEYPKLLSSSVDHFGIYFCEEDESIISKQFKSNDPGKVSIEDLEPGPLTVYPLMGIRSSCWNNNLGSHTWAFLGMNSGLGKLINLSFLECDLNKYIENSMKRT